MKGWKTALAAALITVVGAAETFFGAVQMDPDTQGYVLMGIGVLMAGLRAVTSTPIFKD